MARSIVWTHLSLHKLDDLIIVSNGPCWSPDGRTFYFADSWSGEIWPTLRPRHWRRVNKRTFAKSIVRGAAAPTASEQSCHGEGRGGYFVPQPKKLSTSDRLAALARGKPVGDEPSVRPN
jgi:SMP-30/Gluconolactonase/LRE-like region